MQDRAEKGLFTVLTLVLLVLSGCIDPNLVSERDEEEPPGPFTLVEGWTYQHPDGEFHYTDGMFHATYEGPQIVLRINNTEPLDLGRLTWNIEGEFDLEGDLTRSFLYAVWGKHEPWPGRYLFGSGVTEYAGIGLESGGIQVNQGVRAIAIGDGRHQMVYESGNVVLEPGEWRIWMGLSNFHRMEVQIDLPEGLRLAGPPLIGGQCDVAQPSGFDSTLLATAFPVASVAVDAEWSTEVAKDQWLLAHYHNQGSVHYGQYEFERGNETILQYNSSEGPSSGTQGWNGQLLTSTSPGTHNFRVIQEARAVLTNGPKVIYCVL